MTTTDIRFNRVNKEYLSLRETQGQLFDKVDTFEGAILGLTEVVSQNRDLIMENRDLIMENRDLIMENRDLIMENREMLLAIIDHLKVPYERRPMGFAKE